MKTSATALFENKRIVPKEFNKIAARYDLATALSQGYQEDLNRSAKLFHLKGDETVIDLCCGTGKSTLAILPEITTGKIICIDNSEGMLAVAAEKFSEEIAAGKVEVALQDAMQLDFPENSVDAVFMAYGLRNMPDYDACIRALHTLIKPGGQLVIHDYSLCDTWYAKPCWFILSYGFIVPFCAVLSGSASIYAYLAKSVLNFLRPHEITALLQRHGFSDVDVMRHASWRKPFLHSFSAVKAKE
jgi:ubiquinone/menaquinone biosynthesis methyltransferase